MTTQNWRMGAAAKTRTGNVLPEESTNDRQMVAPAAQGRSRSGRCLWSVRQALTAFAYPAARAKSDLEDHQTCECFMGFKVCARQGFVLTPSHHTNADSLCRAHANGVPSAACTLLTHHALTSLMLRSYTVCDHQASGEFRWIIPPADDHLLICPARPSE